MKLESKKTFFVCLEICDILKKVFDSFHTKPWKLFIGTNYFVHYSRNEDGSLDYVSISKRVRLNDYTETIKFFYAYLNEDLRNKGIGTNNLKTRVSYFKNKYPNAPITATCRINNGASLKAFRKAGFTACLDFVYSNGEKGVKFVLL